MWPRHVVVLMCAAAAPLGEYGLEDPTAASGVQPIVQFLMAGEGYQKRGEAHFVVRRLRAVRALADDPGALRDTEGAVERLGIGKNMVRKDRFKSFYSEFLLNFEMSQLMTALVD